MRRRTAFACIIWACLVAPYFAIFTFAPLVFSTIGVAASFSRIGAASGTFLLPLGIEHFGIASSMLIGAACCAVGLVVTYMWAPETTGISLTKTSAVEEPSPGGGAPAVAVAPS